MPYTLEKLPDSPIVLFTQLPDSDESAEIRSIIADVTGLLDQQTEQVFLVLDLRNSKASLEDLIGAANLLARGENSMLHHPNVRENVYVTTDLLMKMASKGLASATFGKVKLSQFSTPEEALAYCHKTLGAA